jgi:hypothetical protein
VSERYDYGDFCCAEGHPVTGDRVERDPVSSPSARAQRSILKATHTPDARAVYGISLMILLAALALASMLLSGCRTVDQKAVDGAKKGVRIMTGKARLNAPWSGEELATLDAEEAAIDSWIDAAAK